MYAMPRKTFKSTATALLAIPSSSSGALAARTERSVSPFRSSRSMTLPAPPHVIRPTTSCHSSPGNAHDAYRTIIDLPLPRRTTTPEIRPAQPPDVAIEREDWKQLLKSKDRYEMLRKAIGFLHDNRAVSSKHPKTARRLREINADLRADTSCRVLKFILNALFILVGLLLLLSVLAAIGYTSTG